MYKGGVEANKTDGGRKKSLLTHKWIKYKGHGSWLGYNMERQQELQVNMTNIAKMKKNGSERSNGECETQAWGKKTIAK